MIEPVDGSRTDPLDQPVSRRRAALWLLVLRYIALGLAVVRTIAVVPLLLKLIGEHEFGYWVSSGAVLMQLASTNFGFLGVLAQRVAAAYGMRDRDQLERLLGTGFVTAAVLSVLLTALCAALAPFLPGWYDIEGEMARRLIHAFALTAVANGLQVFGFAMASLLESFQRTAFSGVQYVLSELLALGCTLWLVLEGWGLYGVAWGLIVRALWFAAANGLRCLWLFRRELRLAWRWDGSLFRSMWGASVHVFIMQLANWARVVVAWVLVGKLLGPKAATQYAVTTQAHDMMRLLVLTVGAASNAGLAHLFGEGNAERFKRVISIRYALQGAAAAIGLGGVLAFNEAFVSLWVGPEAYAGHWVNALAVIATGSFILATVPYDGLQARGEFSVLSKSLVTDTVVRASSICLLLLVVGLPGAPAGNAIAQTFVLMLPLALLLADRLGQSRQELFSEVGLRVTRIVLPVLGLSIVALLLVPRGAGWTLLIVQGARFTLLAALAVALVDRPLTRFVLSRGRAAI